MIQNATSIRTHTEIYINCEGPKKKKKKSFKNILFIKETIKYIISKSINHRVETVTILPKRDSKYLYYVPVWGALKVAVRFAFHVLPFFFFNSFFFNSAATFDQVFHEQCIYALFMDPQI